MQYNTEKDSMFWKRNSLYRMNLSMYWIKRYARLYSNFERKISQNTKKNILEKKSIVQSNIPKKESNLTLKRIQCAGKEIQEYNSYIEKKM